MAKPHLSGSRVPVRATLPLGARQRIMSKANKLSPHRPTFFLRNRGSRMTNISSHCLTNRSCPPSGERREEDIAPLLLSLRILSFASNWSRNFSIFSTSGKRSRANEPNTSLGQPQTAHGYSRDNPWWRDLAVEYFMQPMVLVLTACRRLYSG